MPFAQIYMLEGRTAEQKKAVIEKVTQGHRPGPQAVAACRSGSR
jgi:hypothetical protein